MKIPTFIYIIHHQKALYNNLRAKLSFTLKPKQVFYPTSKAL